MYNYRVGSYEGHRAFLSRSLHKIVWLGMGGVAGVLGGLYAAVAITQAGVQPLVVTQDSRNVLPIVHALQQNSNLYVISSVSSADDLQPASGYNVIQRTERVQP